LNERFERVIIIMGWCLNASKFMSKFQIIFLSLCIFFIVVGVILFAGLKSGSNQELPQVTIWGLMSQDIFAQYISNLNAVAAEPLKVEYIEKDPGTFDREFVEALALGQGPDLVLISQDFILKEQNKLYIIPYEAVSERTFKDTFIEEAELLLTKEGLIGIPFSVDPLVMYWNRDIFSGAALARFPEFWEDVTAYTPKLVNRDNASNISGAAVALGEARNVNHAKEIIATLLMQAGNPIVMRDESSRAVSVIDKSFSRTPSPIESVLGFYTGFSNPTSPIYTWNRALPTSKNFFISGDVAMYFGPASEVSELRAKNPQLNFDVALFPQPKQNKNKLTFGTMYAFAIPRNSPSIGAAYSVLSTLTSANALKMWTDLTYLPPVRRDLLALGTTDPYLSIFYTSAIMARGWLDPDSNATTNLFQNMVESVISGKERANEAAVRTNGLLQQLITP